MPADITHEKRALRAELRERRRTQTSTARDQAAEQITAHLIELATRVGARSLACYLSAPDEPSTRPFLGWAESHGIRVLFPVSRQDGLLDWAVGDGHTETQGLFGMPEPVGQLLGPIAINDVDLIVVPAATVDRQGMRMGWGRGYFDKTLGSMEKCPPVYAVVFDSELVDRVPSEVHDQAVDGVVTPSGIVDLRH
ncbi:5-formyltetrahydrofolate cyclo-ligase [Rathayibacter sp. AY1G1]|jgi:5-formyltetrahydrofolate cyclo-ligase|uniref:5-formyltetrahydrofolate cyclo-ligase n=1 Tax=unclassified Rathayibacter TaxID=2609250 RepID=UPI000CE925E1|nr:MULTISPECIES: 5-formyltetrahydrofolate cyclo-ligase [unclassified Rathayibacter]PPF13487.1 5-formyltetrahydrofolate cyclo-ligase [Rathayibacter sp. AY1A5]PPF37300.1 5-formyltetrahydrofolate cyclo-ligase [Rathayibacter sp. AY1A3]PPF48928.1 5-formyltetrahydrofolate cyclo-ligase [Rathayibacter sp. AY1A1]PPF59247.1 5-formyltetrahydrofolate cyclo-ligase [Rathayibacter sp. AY1C2]PPF71786.1 5-formyltetrahydrofolate cyclo-ligase [Rathayibacter sp. AY1E6]